MYAQSINYSLKNKLYIFSSESSYPFIVTTTLSAFHSTFQFDLSIVVPSLLTSIFCLHISLLSLFFNIRRPLQLPNGHLILSIATNSIVYPSLLCLSTTFSFNLLYRIFPPINKTMINKIRVSKGL